MLDVKNISFSYDNEETSLKNINLNINKGECILLCGESGCGKTTLTKVINGLIPHFYENGKLTGEVIYESKIIAEMKMYEIAKIIGSVFQNPKSQFFHTQSNSEIAFGLENEGLPSIEIKNRLKEVVEELKIKNLTNRNVFNMSGGEKQQLAFASIYAMNPEIYVLDEPTANIDEKAIEKLTKIIKKIKDRGHTIIIAEHRLFFLKELIDKAVYIKNGKIDKVYCAEEFFDLRDEQRIEMGLRTLEKSDLCIPENEYINKSNGLIVENLRCSFNNHDVFNNVSFILESNDIIGIVGKNGVGKSTLCRCIAGLVKEKDGTIRWDGEKLSPKERRKLCSLVMQDVNHQLFSDSVYNECKLGVDSIADEYIFKVLDQFDLLEYKDVHPMALSGGQKQRLAIVTSILSNKKILIFDEPTSGLDYRRMVNVSERIKELSKEGHCIIIISHDIEFLNITCKHIFKI